MRQGKSSQKDKKINYTYRISSFYLFFLTREKIVHDTIAVHLLILLVKKDIKLTFFHQNFCEDNTFKNFTRWIKLKPSDFVQMQYAFRKLEY